MLISAFRSLWNQLLVISTILTITAIIVWSIDGREAAISLLQTTIAGMKGPWVWTFGYGLASFITHRGRLLPIYLTGILVPNEVTAEVVARIEKSTFHKNALRYTVFITCLGIFLTSVYGIPHKKVAYTAIFIGVCSIYYIAAFLLFHFVEVTLAFHELFERMDEVEFRTVYNPFHLENLTTYLALTTGIGLIAIYAGFRGTLTAGFQFHHEIWRLFLSIPLVLFLPGTLFYNYYPRYVLRKILQHRVFKTMERLGTGDEQNVKSLLLELRECAASDSHILPFLDYKSLSSYLIAVLFVISLAYNNDPAIQTFIRYIVNLGSK